MAKKKSTAATTPQNPNVGPSAFGKRTLAFRQRFGLSREMFAAAVHVAYTTVRGWEKHGRTPSRFKQPDIDKYMERRASA